MQPQDIQLTDWARIWLGKAPPAILLELLIRAAFVYFLLMLAMRLLGSRMASQLNRTELAAVVSLAAAVGVPLLAPDRGLLPALVVTLVVVGITRLASGLSARNPKVESAVQGDVSVLVDNSCLQLDAMHKSRVTRERVLAHLRSDGLTHLGKVKRLYLEANGTFTIVPQSPPQPGLSIIPDWDGEFVQRQPVGERGRVCSRCGCRRKAPEIAACANCGGTSWVDALA